MYRKMDIAERAAKIAEMAKQLDILEGLVDGPQAVAAAGGPTTADAAIFPILVFCKEARAHGGDILLSNYHDSSCRGPDI